MEKTTLEKINRFTRRELGEDEVYTFSVILCDNDIDRDLERFSDEALVTLAEKFIGRTGISDHDPSSANQTARIFDTQIMTDESRTTAYGAPYRYLKAEAYMVRTSSNAELIKEIDGGIKKEVSISCSAAKRTCSVCGSENGSKKLRRKGLPHYSRRYHGLIRVEFCCCSCADKRRRYKAIYGKRKARYSCKSRCGSCQCRTET